jgi:hypothetical protein
MSNTAIARTGLRFLAFGAVLALAGACEAGKMAKEDQPLVTVKGSVVTDDGTPASDCKLEFYDTATVKPNYIWDVPANFTHKLQTAKVVENFYFRVRCKGARVAARSRIYSMTYLSDNDFIVDLGRVTVGAGMIAVTGQVVTQDGAAPAACKLGLYTGFHTKPSVSWDVAGAIAVAFEREKVDGHFQFRLACEGYAEPFNSPKRPESWLDEAGGKIELGDMLVRK